MDNSSVGSPILQICRLGHEYFSDYKIIIIHTNIKIRKYVYKHILKFLIVLKGGK